MAGTFNTCSSPVRNLEQSSEPVDGIPWLPAVVLKLKCVFKLPWLLSLSAGTLPRVSDSVDVGWDPRMCISNRSPGASDAGSRDCALHRVGSWLLRLLHLALRDSDPALPQLAESFPGPLCRPWTPAIRKGQFRPVCSAPPTSAPSLSLKCQSKHCLPSSPHQSGPTLCWLLGLSLVPVLQWLRPTKLQARKTVGSDLPYRMGSLLGQGQSPGFLPCLMGFY